MKTLLLVRHAKSSWKDDSLRDFDRPLNKRGKRDAPLMGKLLLEKQCIPEKIISSPALRAWTTAKILAKELHYPREAILKNPLIYEADLVELVDVIRHLDDAFSSVMLVGHNPAFHDFARCLLFHPILHFPTCSVLQATQELNSWHDVCDAVWQCKSFFYPKKDIHK